MAEQGPPQPLMSAPFPGPPPFFKSFTFENIAKIEELQNVHRKAAQTFSPSAGPIPFSLPTELRFSTLAHLIPPPPPPDGAFRLFGQQYNINPLLPPLPDGTPLLYTSPPTPASLLQLSRSIMINFYEFVNILAENPDEYPLKWDNLAALFRNTERALNEYRPFLAREEMIRRLEEEVRRGKEEIEGVKAMRRKVDDVLGGIREGVVKVEGARDTVGQIGAKTGVKTTQIQVKDSAGSKADQNEERAMWDILHGI